jgi:hypothetical protein
MLQPYSAGQQPEKSPFSVMLQIKLLLLEAVCSLVEVYLEVLV